MSEIISLKRFILGKFWHCLLQWHLFYDMSLSKVSSCSENYRQIIGFVVGREHLNHSRDLGWLWHLMRFFLGKCEFFTSDGSPMADQRNNPTWVFIPEQMSLLGSLIRYWWGVTYGDMDDSGHCSKGPSQYGCPVVTAASVELWIVSSQLHLRAYPT